MLIPPNVFHVSKVAATEGTRYTIDGVQVGRDPEGNPFAVATDGKRLLAVKWPEDPADEYPAGVGDVTKVADFKVVVPRKAWEDAAKLAPRRPLKPILANVLLDEPRAKEGERIPLAATDLESVQRVEPRPPQGYFPPWESVVPHYKILAPVEGDRRRIADRRRRPLEAHARAEGGADSRSAPGGGRGCARSGGLSVVARRATLVARGAT